MGTLHQYFETDFSHATRMHVKLSVEGADIDGIVLFDFSGYAAFLSCYVPGNDRKLLFFVSLLKSLGYGETPLQLAGRVTLPSTKEFFGELKIENKEDFEILARFFGDPTWTSTKEIGSTRRVYIYSESNLTSLEIVTLKEEAARLGHDVQFRSDDYMAARIMRETPVAFICHDSRDKDDVARKLAINLQRMLCPVWYDEFSLRIGASLRESIEKGLKECKKCILV